MTVAQLPLPLAFILSNIPDYQHLADSLSAQADVHIIDANGDALAQMAAIAASYSELSAIHLYSHGAAGQIDLGGVTLNNTNVMQYSETLAQIGAALSETGDILLYGCHVAAGEAGAELIGKLAQVTNADIAASTDLTGAAALGGDWVLEATSGVIEAESIGAYGYDHSLVGYTWNMSASAITPSGNGGTPYQINTEISIGYNQPEVPSAPGTITAVWYDSTDGRELTTQTWTPAATGAQTHNFAYQPGPSDISTLDGDTVKVTFTVSSSNFSPATTATSDYTYSAANWAPPNSAPTAGNGGSVDIAVGNSLQSSDLNNSNTGSSDPDSDTLTYSITSGVTASANAALKGRMQVGTASYSINDGHDHTANGQVAVYATYADDPISWSTAASTFNTTWNTSGNNSLQLSGATDPDDGVAYSLVSVDGGLVPSWMSITSGGLISANTAPEHAGHTYTVVARASATGSVDKSFTITIGNAASVNDIPTISSNGSKTVAEDPTNALAFSASDFHFADLDNSAGGSTATGAALATIRIDSLPTHGTFVSGGADVVAGDEIAVDDISTLIYTPNENYSGSESFTYSVNDGIAWSASPATMNITVTPTNDAPVIDNSNEAVPTLTTHTENETTNAGNLISDLVARTSVDNAKTAVSDVDTLNNSGAGNAPEAVGLGVAIYALADTSLTGAGAWEYSTNNGASWTAIGSVSATNALLLSASDKVRFVPDTHNAVDAYFDFYAWDYATGTHGTKVDVSTRGNATAFSTGSDRANIAITSVNDAPTLDLDASAGGTGYTGSYIVRGNGVKIADTDSSILDIDKMFDPDTEGSSTLPDTIASATVTISAGAIDNGFGEIFEQLTYPNPEMVYESWYANNITISGSGTDSITISGKGSWSDYQNIIEAITYKNTNPDAIPGDRSITVTITDSNLTAAGDALTATATATIANIWAPVVDTNGTAEGLNYTNTFTEGGNGVRIVAASAEIIDQDGNLSQVVVSISNVQNAGLETLTFSGGNGVWGSTGLTVSGSGTSSITISGNISPASYNQVLRSITYSNSSENPDTTARTITIAATDAESHTGVSETTGHTTISVVPVNDLPTSVGGSESIAEDGGVAGSLTFGAADFNFADLDATAGHTNDVGATLASIRIDTLTGHGTLKLDGTNVTVGDVIAVANIGNLTYTPNENYSGSDSFTYSLNDGYVGSDNNGWSTTSSTMSLTVVPENDAPLLVDTTATLTTIDENATTNSGNFINDLVGSQSRTDVDTTTNQAGEGTATGVAIYALSSTDADGTGSGTWQYSTAINGGASYSEWTNIGTVSETSALLLSSLDKVRFVPDTYNGSTVSFSYHIWDEATGTHGSKVDVSTRGGTTAFSTDSDTAALTVTSVNDAPTLDLDTTADGTGYTTTYRVREGQVSIVKQDVASVVKVAVGDVDQGSSISKLTVAIASGAYDNQNGTIYETLTIASGMLSDLIAAGASVTGNGTPSISIEIGTSTYAYEAILKSISYENANPNAYMGTRTVDIKVYDDTNVVSNTATTIINSVWAPVVDANGALANYTHTAASFTEGSATGVKVVAADASITDQDSLIKSMVISIADVDNEGFETLTIPDATVTALQNNGFTITGNGTAELTIAATNATLGKSTNLFQSALRTVEYKNTSGEIDGSSTRDITITVTDVNNNVGVVGHSTIDMIAVNSAPVISSVPYFYAGSSSAPYYFVEGGVNGVYSYETTSGTTSVSDGNLVGNDFTLHFSDSRSHVFLQAYVPGGSLTVTYFDGNNQQIHQESISGYAGIDWTSSSANIASIRLHDNANSNMVYVARMNLDAVGGAPSTLTSISEDPTTNTGTTIATLIADGRIVDSDVTTAVKAIAVSAVDTTHGTWEYKIGSGTWTAFDFTGNNSGKGLLLDATDAVRFVPNSNYNGTATFTYSAWDKDTGTAGNYLTLDGNTGGTKTLSSTTDTATITITAVNDAPAFSSATATISIDENTTAVGNANASDVDNQSLTYTITGGSDSALFNIDSNTGALSFINAPNYEGVHGNSYAVTIQTSDGSLTASQDVTININDVNEAPTLVSPIDDVTQTGAGSVSVNTSTHFTDQDANTRLTYSAQLVSGEDLVVLPSWLSINSATGVISGNPPVGAESVIVRVTATDNANSALSTSDNFAITLSGSLNDTPTVPTFTTPFEDVGGTPTIDPAKTGAGDMGPVVVPAFGDGDGDTLTYSTSVVKVNGEPATGEAANLPSWLSFNATTRTFTGNPPAGAENTTYTVRVAVSDGHGGTTSQDIDLVFGSGLNDTPTVPTPLADPSSKTGDGAMTPVEVPAFGDADGDTLSYTATLTNGNPLPSWLSFDATTRTFTGNPPAGAENTTVDVRVTGTDGHGGTVSDDISLSFGTGLNDTPTVPTPLADPSSKSGSGAMTPVVVPVFGDADGDTLSYSATLTNGNPLPSWLSFDATTRTFTGNPPAGAENTTVDVRVTGTDGHGGTVSDDISLSFGTGLNDTPTVPTPLADPSSKSGSGAMTPVVVPVFGDADGDTLSYSATLTNGNPLPSWLSFDATTRTFTGNPPAGAENTTLDVRVTGTDGNGGSISDDISLSFGTGLNDTPMVPTPLADPSSKSGSGAMTPVVVPVFGDADGDTLSYSATLTNGNPLPSWLSFNATTRTFTGNPPAGAENTTVDVRVTGTDASGASVSDDISLSFGSNLNDAPTVATIPTQTPTLDESGRISVNVSESFSDPDGNSLTYSAILTTGSSLPSWLSVDPETGALSGNPPLGTASPLSVVLTATDTSGATVSSIVAINLTGNLNTLSGLPSPAQAVVAGALTQLADFSITDELNSTRTFSVTLTPTNGVIYGLTDTDSHTTGIQLTGTKAEVEALIAKATFIASAAGSASIAIAVYDGDNTTTSTYQMVASAATHTDNREESSQQDPTTVTQVVIAPIDNVTTGQSSDYPLFWGEATKTAWATTANLPVGVGLVTSGSLAPSSTQTTQSSIADLIALIDATASATEKGSMESGGQAFLSALDLVDTLVVSKLTLTSSSGASAGSVHISGTTNDVLNAVNGTQAPTEALVVDGSALPTGSILFLDNIDFASIVGDGLTIRGGDGENVVFTGEGRQNIQLGAGDDELHAGAGNDWVGSQSGNDLIFGDAGNDFIYGGAGDDTLDGGTGMDTAVYAGNRADYTLTKVSQTQWTVSSVAEGTDTLLNVEFVQFTDQSLTLVGNSQWLNQVAQSAVLFF